MLVREEGRVTLLVAYPQLILLLVTRMMLKIRSLVTLRMMGIPLTLEWTTVQRKRRGKKYGSSKERSSRRDVSAAVNSFIIEAEKSVTTSQKEMTALWQKKVNLNPPEESVPHEEGPA